MKTIQRRRCQLLFSSSIFGVSAFAGLWSLLCDVAVLMQSLHRIMFSSVACRRAGCSPRPPSWSRPRRSTWRPSRTLIACASPFMLRLSSSIRSPFSSTSLVCFVCRDADVQLLYPRRSIAVAVWEASTSMAASSVRSSGPMLARARAVALRRVALSCPVTASPTRMPAKMLSASTTPELL
eukprot:scaffold7362_cov266-Pinguiococcus_pyrenoidosus.AAC.10